MEIKFYSVPWTQDGEDKFDMTYNKLEDILASDNCAFLGRCDGGITYTSSLNAKINVNTPKDFDIKNANYIYIPEKKEGWYLSDFQYMNSQTLTLSLEYDIWSNTFSWDCFIQENAVNIQRQHMDRYVNNKEQGYPMDFNQNTSKVFFKDEVLNQYGTMTSVDESDTLSVLPRERLTEKIIDETTPNIRGSQGSTYISYTLDLSPRFNNWKQEYMCFLTTIDKTKYEIYFRLPKSLINDNVVSAILVQSGRSLETTLLTSSYVTQKFIKKLPSNNMFKITNSVRFRETKDFSWNDAQSHTVSLRVLGDREYEIEAFTPVESFNENVYYLVSYVLYCFITQQTIDDDKIKNGTFKTDMKNIFEKTPNQDGKINLTFEYPPYFYGRPQEWSVTVPVQFWQFPIITYEKDERIFTNYTAFYEDKFNYPIFKYIPSATYEYRNEPRIYLDDIICDYYWANNISLKLPVYANLNTIEILETTPITNQEFSLTALSDQNNKSTNFESEFYNVNRSHRAGSNGTNALPVLIDSEVQTLSRQKSSINNQAKWDSITGGLGGASQMIAGGGQMLTGALMGDAGAVGKGAANVTGGLINAITAPIRARETKKATLNDIKRSPDEVSGQGGLIQINSVNGFKPAIIRKQLPDWTIETVSLYFHKYGYKAPETKILYRVLEYKRKNFNYFEIEGMGDACILNQTFKEYYNALFSQGVRIWWDCRKKFRDYTLPNNEVFIEND